jgi:hypothetical protein
MHQSLLNTLQECAVVCQQTSVPLMSRPDATMRANQMKLMRDCAEICNLCVKYLSWSSPFSKSLCDFCAYVCECCANECLKFSDRESQFCAQTCLNCARQCRAFAMTA